MYGVEYLDESVIDEAKKLFKRCYSDNNCYVIGVANDRKNIIVESMFPDDGPFYFKIDLELNSVSQSFDSIMELEKSII